MTSKDVKFSLHNKHITELLRNRACIKDRFDENQEWPTSLKEGYIEFINTVYLQPSKLANLFSAAAAALFSGDVNLGMLACWWEIRDVLGRGCGGVMCDDGAKGFWLGFKPEILCGVVLEFCKDCRWTNLLARSVKAVQNRMIGSNLGCRLVDKVIHEKVFFGLALDGNVTNKHFPELPGFSSRCLRSLKSFSVVLTNEVLSISQDVLPPKPPNCFFVATFEELLGKTCPMMNSMIGREMEARLSSGDDDDDFGNSGGRFGRNQPRGGGWVGGGFGGGGDFGGGGGEAFLDDMLQTFLAATALVVFYWIFSKGTGPLKLARDYVLYHFYGGRMTARLSEAMGLDNIKDKESEPTKFAEDEDSEDEGDELGRKMSEEKGSGDKDDDADNSDNEDLNNDGTSPQDVKETVVNAGSGGENYSD
ncbi:hypothetical protein AKJ16_DCAP17338 [Drosera capensis]